MKRILGMLSVIVVGAAGIAACGDGEGGGSGGSSATDAECPVGAHEDAEGTIDLTFWHAMNEANETALQAIIDDFEASQDKVTVTLVNQTSYKDLFDKFISGLSTGDLPDLAQGQEIRLQELIDTQASLPIQACIDADDYDLSDYVTRMTDYYTVEDALWNMPFNPSNPILLYNRNSFTAAGLDPDDPPANLEEYEAAARAIKDAGVMDAPIAIKMDPWFLEQWSAKAGELYANNGNGRESRATEVSFDSTDAGLETFEFLRKMVDEGLAVTNPSEGAEGVNNLLAIGAGTAAMTIDSSAGLGTIFTLLESGQYPNVSAGVGPMPGPDGDGGVLVGGASLFITNTGVSDERKAAAWEFIKFATTPEQQAQWSVATGYLPVRESAVDQQVLIDRWTELPAMRVAYDQFFAGAENLATAGAAIGPFEAIRDVIRREQEAMLLGQKSPQEALDAAAAAANQLIADYNGDLGL